MLIKFLVLVIFLVNYIESAKWTLSNNIAVANPCKNTKDFTTEYEINSNCNVVSYDLYLSGHQMDYVQIQFNNPVNISLERKDIGVFTYLSQDLIVVQLYPKSQPQNQVKIHVAALPDKLIPYVTSILINGIEECTLPDVGIYSDLVFKRKRDLTSDARCGQKQLLHTELVTHSILSKPGDWPWHAALYRQDRLTYDYKCGGTLLSNTVVLTAAHCLMRKGVNRVFPINRLKIFVGKYNLNDKDDELQEKLVRRIIINRNFNTTNLNHDISILKLETEVHFNAYVQPACIWNSDAIKKLANADIYGTVVGWGYDENDHLSTQLRQATLPIFDGLTCVLSNNIFFGKYLNQYKFCAGYTNGTSACNGDSGGGFVVFVPDLGSSTTNEFESGSWYVRGVVSVAVSRRDANICARKSYVLFTDVSKYTEWIQMHMVSDINEEPFQTAVFNEPETVEFVSRPTCGRREILHTALMTHSEEAQRGHWPWHVAVYKMDNSGLKYQCGGTLISKNIVITGTTCVYSHSAQEVLQPRELIISLGKQNLEDFAEEGTQSRSVSQIIIHENYNRENYSPDIALVKLSKDVVYGPYVQPACLWNKDANDKIAKTRLYYSGVFGTVAGWGFDETGTFSKYLKAATMPIVDDRTCAIKSPIFQKFIQGRFCAGLANGTSPCKGDSGGGFMVFIPDSPETYTENINMGGSWYLRGLVSVSTSKEGDNGVRSCDNYNYVYYTDMNIMTDWVQSRIANWIF